jgi:hypothetical protein
MTHANRDSIAVALRDNCWLYTDKLPIGSRFVGVVSCDGSVSESGALVRIIATGIYAQVNNGIVRALDQAKVRAALAEIKNI